MCQGFCVIGHGAGAARPGRALPVRPSHQSNLTVPFRFRSLRALLGFAALCCLSGFALGQGGISISSGAPITAGKTACVIVSAPGSSAGALSVTVELNGVVLRSTCSFRETGMTEVCFYVPDGALGGQVEITVTTGGVSASNTFGVT